MPALQNSLSIEGLAAVFSERDLNGDVIVPGAFAKTLDECRRPVRLLFQHQPDKIVGLVHDLKETDEGLFISGSISRDFTAGRAVIPMLESCALDGLSIGFQTVRARRNRGGRMLLEVDLWEVSLVTFPMAKRARIARLGETELSARAA